jgi:hypothetical protein
MAQAAAMPGGAVWLQTSMDTEVERAAGLAGSPRDHVRELPSARGSAPKSRITVGLFMKKLWTHSWFAALLAGVAFLPVPGFPRPIRSLDSEGVRRPDDLVPLHPWMHDATEPPRDLRPEDVVPSSSEAGWKTRA